MLHAFFLFYADRPAIGRSAVSWRVSGDDTPQLAPLIAGQFIRATRAKVRRTI